MSMRCYDGMEYRQVENSLIPLIQEALVPLWLEREVHIDHCVRIAYFCLCML